MKLLPLPVNLITMEQLIAWSVGEMLKEISIQGITPTVVEQEGYFASQALSVVPIQTLDSGSMRVFRLLIPSSNVSFAEANPDWQYAGEIFKSRPGLDGLLVPGTTIVVRLNPAVSSGIVEVKASATAPWVNLGGGANVVAAWLGADNRVYIRASDGVYYSNVVSGNATSPWSVETLTAFNSRVTMPSSVRL